MWCHNRKVFDQDDMNMKKMMSAAALAGLCLVSVPNIALAQTSDSGWKFSVMPYLWLPSVDGQLNYGPPPQGGGSPSVSIDAEKLLDALEMAAMITGSARKERWVIATDFMYLNMGTDKSKVRSVDLNPGPGRVNVATTSINGDANVDLKGTIWTLAGGYSVVQTPKMNIDVIAGFRYLGLEATTNWTLSAAVTGTHSGQTATFSRSGSVTQRDDIWAALIGTQGRFVLGDSPWFANYYLDMGTGSSVFTWQGSAGVGYAFKWGDVVLDYRYLSYSQDGDKKLIDNLNFGGLGLGLNFRF
jgi:hypothetical protein